MQMAYATAASAVRGCDMYVAGFMAGVAYRRLTELDLPPWVAAFIIIAAIVLAYFSPDDDDDKLTPRW